MTALTRGTNRSLLRSEEPEWLVWGMVLLLLVVGLVTRTIVTGRTQEVVRGNVSLRVPADWIALSADDAVLRVSEPLETTLFPAAVSIHQTPLADITDDPEVTLGDLALRWTNRQGADLTSYKVLAIEPAKVKDRDAVKVSYVYVTEPALAGPNSIPIVAEGQDVLLKQGDRLTVASFIADSDVYAEMSAIWQRIFDSLALQ